MIAAKLLKVVFSCNIHIKARERADMWRESLKLARIFSRADWESVEVSDKYGKTAFLQNGRQLC